MSDSSTLWTAAWRPSLSFTISGSLLKLMSIESVIPSDHLILCCPLLLVPSLNVMSKLWATTHVQARFRKGRGTRDQIANICWIMGRTREFQKNIYFCFLDYTKVFDRVDHNKLWKILKEMGIQTTWPASWEICTQARKQQLEPDMENRLVPNWERSMSKLYIATLFF